MPAFAVTQERFGEFDFSRGLRQQVDWDAHAAFMDRLADDGLILLGGPLDDGVHVLMVVEAADPEEIRARFGADPWADRLVRIARIQPWEILLGSERYAALRG